jgi:excisionase family DNA binding protein
MNPVRNNDDQLSTEEPLLLTVSAVAKLLSFCERTVRRLIENGQLSFVRVGRSIRIEKQSLYHFIEANREYNGECVELVSSLTGEKTCNSISGVMSTRSPSNMEDAKLDDLLKPVVKR